MKKYALLVFAFLTPALAGPPVIWNGINAKFINAGSVQIPGLAPGGVCTIDSTGLLEASTLNDILPAQASHAGEFLSTNGTNTSWAPIPAPTGTANRFAGFNGSGVLESVNNWVRNTFLGASVNQAPSLTDTGSTASAILNQNTTAISPTNNLTNTYIYQDLTQVDLTGTFDYAAFTGHEFSVTQSGASDIGDLVLLFPRVNLGVGGGTNTSTNVRVIDSNVRLSGGHAANTVKGVSSTVQMDGATSASEITGFLGSTYSGGTVDYAYGISSLAQIAGGATLNQTLYGANIGSQVDSGGTANNAITQRLFHSGSLTGNYTGQSLFANNGTIGGDARLYTGGSDSVVTGNLMLFDAGTTNTVGGDFTGYYLNDGTTTTGQKTLFAGSHYGSSGGDLYYVNVNGSGNTTGNFRAAAFSNSGTVAQFGSGFSLSQSGDVTKGFDVFNANISGDVGDGSGTNLNGFSLTSASGKTIDGDLFGVNINSQADVTGQIFGLNIVNSGVYGGGFFGLNVSNSGNMTGNNTFSGGNVVNNGTGYRFSGYGASNNANMSEEIRGFSFNSTGDSRTSTGLDISMTGDATDDATGVRVNVSSQTSASTTNHVRSGAFEGGTFNVQGAFTPFDGTAGPVDIGNNFTMTSTIQSGSPLANADHFVQFFQSNLLAQDDISTGPIGLDTTMYGFVSQAVVDTGKSTALVRTMLLGTSLPTGGGGTITEHVVLELLGLPSFGGTATNPTRIGIQDSTLLGQNFCDGATDCWFLRVRDTNAQVSLAGPVNTDQGVRLSTSGAQPTCDAAHRGLTWNVEGGAGVADLFQVCQKTVLDTYVWITH